jgi:hypothetical protein
MGNDGQETPRGPNPDSCAHDLLSIILGMFAAFLLLTLRLQIAEPAVNYPFYKGPYIFPIIVLVVMVIASLPSLYHLIRTSGHANWRLDGYGWPIKPAIVTFMLVLFFLFGISWIGMEISVFSFMVLSLLILGYRRLRVIVLFPLLYTLLMVVIFKYLLKIWFPEPSILNLFGA